MRLGLLKGLLELTRSNLGQKWPANGNSKHREEGGDVFGLYVTGLSLTRRDGDIRLKLDQVRVEQGNRSAWKREGEGGFD